MALPIITDQQFRDEYIKFQKLFKNSGTDAQFAEYLNERYKPKITAKFNAEMLYAKRKLMGIKSPVQSGVNPTNLQRQKDINNFLEKEIAKANAGEKFVTQSSLGEKAKQKLNLPAKFGNIKNAPDAYPVLGNLQTRAEKIDQVLKNLLMEDKPLKQNWGFEVMKRTGIGVDSFKDLLKSGSVPTYEVIKDQGADYINRNYGRTFPKIFYTLPFTEQLSYATEMEEGRPVYTKGPKGMTYGSRPDQKIMQFAMRNWNLNEGQGPIKFFDSKGKLVPWKYGLKLPYTKVSFSYDGKLHSYKDLNDVRYMKQYFPEAYDKAVKLKSLKNKLIDNPFGKGKIKVEELVKRIQVEGYNWSPKAPAMDILHGPKGVRIEPFTNLSFNTRDINQLGSGVDSAMRTGIIGKRDGQRILKSLAEALPGDETDIIKRQVGLAEKIKKGTMFGYKDMSGAVRGLFESADRPTILKIRRAVGCGDWKEGGRIELQSGGNILTCPIEKFEKDPQGFTNKVNQLEDTASGLTKFKNAATKFLQNPLLRKGGKFGALAAVGAAGAGVVKTFMNDDPTTYLSDENQQKNMLIEMVTGPMVDKPDPTPEILDYQLPAIGATAAAGTAVTAPSTIEAARSARFGKKPSGYTKTALKTLGRGLAATGTPLGLAAFEPLHIAGQVQQGDSLGEIATNPWNYAGLAFADDLTKFTTKGLGPNIAKAMRLGISPAALRIGSRFLGLPGLALSLGISGYETYDDWKKKRGWFSEE